MIVFLFKGILRDRGRSLFPFIAVTAGVFLTVALYCYLQGVVIDITRSNANLHHGHVKVVTRAYAKDADQVPNDLALTGTGALIADLERAYPGLQWLPRIEFGGLLDIPDEHGETRAQAPVAGLAADLRTPGSPEPRLLNLGGILTSGRLPSAPGELLLSVGLADRLKVGPGDTTTLIGTTMHGAMCVSNFRVAGTIRFGVEALDRMGMIADLADVRAALDMDDAAGEVLGVSPDGLYRPERAAAVAASFNGRTAGLPDEFLPVMQTLGEQPGMDLIFNRIGQVTSLILVVFLLPMSLVMWNAGLVGTLRRYGEIGVRLAMGEDKGHVYRSLVVESLMIGVLGSIAGTILGLAVAYALQIYGIDISGMMKNVSFLMPTVIRARVAPAAFIVGFVPGLLATLIGTGIAGRGIYRRQTAQLFKELEA
jgi:putative ABC transport system permease protein